MRRGAFKRTKDLQGTKPKPCGSKRTGAGPRAGTAVGARGLCTFVPSIADFREPPRILLADDEIDLCWEDCLTELIRSGYHVDTVEDGGAAWEALQTVHYDLFITDNKMPMLWGLDLVIKLRAQGMVLPIIFASRLLPRIRPEQKPCFVNVHFLEKPVTPSQLLAMIDHVALHALPVSPSIGLSDRPVIHSCKPQKKHQTNI